nr:MAG TPA_asm: hypothetical protein [Caudoviricetes sp.]
MHKKAVSIRSKFFSLSVSSFSLYGFLLPPLKRHLLRNLSVDSS